MLGCAFSVVVIVISGQSTTVSSRNKPVNTVLQAQIVVSQLKYSIILERSVASLSISQVADWLHQCCLPLLLQ